MCSETSNFGYKCHRLFVKNIKLLWLFKSLSWISGSVIILAMLVPGSVIILAMLVPGSVIILAMLVPGSVLILAMLVPGRVIILAMLVPGRVIILAMLVPGSTTPVAPTAGMQCRSEEFRCRSGGCIPKVRLCDGHQDCTDGSDEDRQANCTGEESQWSRLSGHVSVVMMAQWSRLSGHVSVVTSQWSCLSGHDGSVVMSQWSRLSSHISVVMLQWSS